MHELPFHPLTFILLKVNKKKKFLNHNEGKNYRNTPYYVHVKIDIFCIIQMMNKSSPIISPVLKTLTKYTFNYLPTINKIQLNI